MVVFELPATGDGYGGLLMIYALATLFGILFLGGLTYFVVNEVLVDFIDDMISAYPTYMMVPEVDFVYQFLYWLPFFIVMVAIISAIVIELRRRSPDAYFSI